MPPIMGNGKICYIEIPALDIARSAEFYERVFGWSIRKRGDGSTAFDDTVGEVSGAWVLGRPPALDSPRGKADRTIYLDTRAMAGSPRWIQANSFFKMACRFRSPAAAISSR